MVPDLFLAIFLILMNNVKSCMGLSRRTISIFVKNDVPKVQTFTRIEKGNKVTQTPVKQ